MKKRFPYFFLIFALMGPAVFAQTENHSLQIEIFLKLIALNRNLDISSKDTVKIGIVYDAGDAKSRENAAVYDTLFSTFSRPPFKDKPLKIVKIANNRLIAADWMQIQGALMIPGKTNRLAAFQEACSNAQALSMTTDSLLVAAGISVCVDVNGEAEPEIWFNVESLRKEAVLYSAEVLRLAKHIIMGN